MELGRATALVFVLSARGLFLTVDEEPQAERPVESRPAVIQDEPSPKPEPFSAETVEELAKYRAILETSFGPVTIEFLPEKAPQHVRNFLRLASLGLYDGCSFHRVVPGLLIETGDLSTRHEPPPEKAMRWVRHLEPELNDTPHIEGTVSMARGDDPAGVSTSFFISTAETSYLNGRYTAFGKVVDGMRIVKAIEALPTDGQTPLTPIYLSRVRVEGPEK